MKRRFLVSANDFGPREVECEGCSGGALTLALQDVQVRHWKVSHKSPTGRVWYFEVKLSEKTKEFTVEILN